MGVVKKILVIPSIREACIKDFLKVWEVAGDWDEIVVVEDNPVKTFDIDVDLHVAWDDIDATLKDDSWIISRHDSAIRSFGFLMAYRMGADYILTLDDDCYPHGTNKIFSSHIERITSSLRWTTSVPGMRTRGLPYKNLGKLNGVVANMGLWSKIPDLDAIQSLMDIELTKGEYLPPVGNNIIPQGQFFPLCGMNFSFHRDVAPLSYFPLMGEGSPYCRFDDIWFGIIFKKIIDHLGYHVSVGEPFVEHQRSSNVFVNLVKEAPGVAANEHFWETIDEVKISENTPKYCMIQLGDSLQQSQDKYISKIGRAIKLWANLF